MAGTNRYTLKPLQDWPLVEQSLFVIVITLLGVRPWLRWFGTIVPALLGRNVEASLLHRFAASIWVAVELWEPRFKIQRFRFYDVTIDGDAKIEFTGFYRPRALFGDFSVEGVRKLYVERSGGEFRPYTP